jgi:hypothetical protein
MQLEQARAQTNPSWNLIVKHDGWHPVCQR